MSRDDAFSEYAAARWPGLVRAAVFLGCGVEEAQDLVQATLLKCYVSWSRVERAEDREAYVYRILVNALRDSRRRRWRHEHPSETVREQADVEVTDATEEVAVADAVHRALAGLTKEQRDVVVLRYFAQLGEQQTATALGIPAGTVKSRLSRALKQLALDPHLSEGMIP